MNRSAVIDSTGAYRYLLSRTWDLELGQQPRRICWVMLNPYSASATKDDPTIRKCLGFSRQMFANGFDVVNLFAYRATNPLALLGPLTRDEAVGPKNDGYILEAAQCADRIIVAWGGRGGLHGRDEEVRRLLASTGKPLMALRLGKHASVRPERMSHESQVHERFPWHPLWAPYNSVLMPWPGVAENSQTKQEAL